MIDDEEAMIDDRTATPREMEEGVKAEMDVAQMPMAAATIADENLMVIKKKIVVENGDCEVSSRNTSEAPERGWVRGSYR